MLTSRLESMNLIFPGLSKCLIKTYVTYAQIISSIQPVVPIDEIHKSNCVKQIQPDNPLNLTTPSFTLI